MSNVLTLDLNPFADDQLEATAATFHTVAESWRECPAADDLVAYFESYARCWREEKVCRDADLEPGIRGFEYDLGAVDISALERAFKLIEREAGDLEKGEPTYLVLQTVAVPILQEIARRAAMAAAEKTDGPPPMPLN